MATAQKNKPAIVQVCHSTCYAGEQDGTMVLTVSPRGRGEWQRVWTRRGLCEWLTDGNYEGTDCEILPAIEQSGRMRGDLYRVRIGEWAEYRVYAKEGSPDLRELDQERKTK